MKEIKTCTTELIFAAQNSGTCPRMPREDTTAGIATFSTIADIASPLRLTKKLEPSTVGLTNLTELLGGVGGLVVWGKRVWVDGEDTRGAARSVFGTGAELGDGEDAGGAKLGDNEGGRQIMWVGERGGCEFSSLPLSFSEL
ncbi:hypothetical protein TIFTF001_008028 [Ficus carica]|uniref:Uncharacterized protein n=1 Tax=Ficus carica TaxID=3494 RepID=A0AA88CXM1_FICCA|nr:hypothetical protein TIFTF001_008028 [Ficus carica]